MNWRIEEKEIDFIWKCIEQDRYQNVYLYIDILTYGFSNDNISTVIFGEGGRADAVMYIYFGSVQMFQINPLSQELSKEIANKIVEMKIKRVSGCEDVVSKIQGQLDNHSVKTSGHIMRYRSNGIPASKESDYAAADDMEEIAQMIIRDEHLGVGYEYESLLCQFKHRHQNDGCENICIKKAGKIISHFATYAVTDKIAVLSGMLTEPEYRGKGYGKILVHDLSEHVVEQGREAILYCYEQEYFTWYQKLGYHVIGTSAKLEINY